MTTFRDDLKTVARDINLLEDHKSDADRYERIKLNKSNEYIAQQIQKYFSEYLLNDIIYKTMIAYGYNLKTIARDKIKQAYFDLNYGNYDNIEVYINSLKDDISKYIFPIWFRETLTVTNILENIVIIKSSFDSQCLYIINIDERTVINKFQDTVTNLIRKQIILDIAIEAHQNNQTSEVITDVPRDKFKKLAVIAKSLGLNISSIVNIGHRLDYFKCTQKLDVWYRLLIEASRIDGLRDDQIRLVLPNLSYFHHARN